MEDTRKKGQFSLCLFLFFPFRFHYEIGKTASIIFCLCLLPLFLLLLHGTNTNLIDLLNHFTSNVASLIVKVHNVYNVYNVCVCACRERENVKQYFLQEVHSNL